MKGGGHELEVLNRFTKEKDLRKELTGPGVINRQGRDVRSGSGDDDGSQCHE